MNSPDIVVLGDEPLPPSQVLTTLDVFSEQPVLGPSSEPSPKRLVEGKVTVGCPWIVSLRSPRSASPETSLEAAYYLIRQPFTVHELLGNRSYRRISVRITLAESGSHAFSVFPQEITQEMGVTTVLLSDELRFEVVENGSVAEGRRFQYSNLRPVIRAYGDGEDCFSWTFDGPSGHPVAPGSKYLLAVLRVPLQCTALRGTISLEALITKPWLGGWIDAEARTEHQEIHWPAPSGESRTPPCSSKSQQNPPRPIKILFLAANPDQELALDTEFRLIHGRLQTAEHEERFQLVQGWDIGVNDLQEALLRHQPQIVHFSGHGNEAGETLLEGKTGAVVPVQSDALARLFAVISQKQPVRCVVLNACFSKLQAEAIAEHVDCVIGMGMAIDDRSAITFAWSFYQALGFSQSVRQAFDLGCSQVDLSSFPGPDTPELIARPGVDPGKVFLLKK